MLKTVAITVSGKVQGVFYRQSAKELAAILNIKGEVRNTPEETVEIIATGTAEEIEKLIKWCWLGPPKAKVINVVISELSLRSFESFNIVRH